MPNYSKPERMAAINQRTTLAIEAIDAAGIPFTAKNLGKQIGVTHGTARTLMYLARKAGVTDRYLLSRVKKPVIVAENLFDQRQAWRIDVADVDRELEDARRDMTDGRDQIDDPFLACGLPPRSNLAPVPPETNAQACRRMLREWRVLTGRAKAPQRRERVLRHAARATRVFHDHYNAHARSF